MPPTSGGLPSPAAPARTAPLLPAGPRSAVAAALLTGLVALTAWGVEVVRWDASRMPDPVIQAAGAQVIREGWQEGDVIRSLPLWNDNQRQGLDGLPFLLSTEMDVYDLHRYERIWFVWPDSHADEAQAELATVPGVEQVWQGGGYHVSRAPVPPGPDVLFDGWVSLQDAVVTQTVMAGDPIACEIWEDERWQCGRRDDFIYVGRVTREMDDTFRHCIMANPPPEQRTWSIMWEDVPLNGTLRVRAGNTLWAFRHDRGSSVLFRVLVNDVEAVRATFEPRVIGYPEFTAELDQVGADRGTVRVEVSATDHMDRFFCFRPQIVADSGGAR